VSKKFILNFAPTGMIPTKKMTPYVPVAVNETIEQVLEAAELGANMVHLHARDLYTGEPTYKKEFYADIIREIRSHFPRLNLCDNKRENLLGIREEIRSARSRWGTPARFREFDA